MRGIWKLGVKLCWPFLQSPYRAVKTYLYLATNSDVGTRTGRYWEHLEEKASSEASYDLELRRRLWEYAEQAVGLEPGVLEVLSTLPGAGTAR